MTTRRKAAPKRVWIYFEDGKPDTTYVTRPRWADDPRIVEYVVANQAPIKMSMCSVMYCRISTHRASGLCAIHAPIGKLKPKARRK